MIVPCIDLMGGMAVQLEQGKHLKLRQPIEQAMAAFEGFPLLHVIDLDAALCQGSNSGELASIAKKFNVRFGGGVRSIDQAEAMLELGASQVILGSAAFDASGIDHAFLQSLANRVGTDRIIIAIDSLGGRVAVKGWRSTIDLAPEAAMAELEPFCAGFLCTSIDHEGLLGGTNLELFASLRKQTQKTLVAAGGITTIDEVEALLKLGVEVALGMAIYTGSLPIPELLKLNTSSTIQP
jgi:phosphoribosylformimino-5-aminoimidazole carboxamide ribotide isomerase